MSSAPKVQAGLTTAASRLHQAILTPAASSPAPTPAPNWSRTPVPACFIPRLFPGRRSGCARSGSMPAPGTACARAANGGATWSTSIHVAADGSGSGAPDRHRHILCPGGKSSNTPSTLYAGTARGVYQSTNAGTNWTLTSTGLVSSIPGSLCAGDRPGPDDAVHSLRRHLARRFLQHQRRHQLGCASGCTAYDVRALAIDPQTPADPLCGHHRCGVYRSTDQGASGRPSTTA